MVVAGAAVCREPEEDPAGRRDTIIGVADEVFLLDGPAFVGGHVAPVEAGGHELVLGRIRQQIPGDLLDHEPVEGLVPVEGGDDPIAVGPHFPVVVEMQAVGVGIAGGIQPVPRPMFAPAGAVQQTVDPTFVGIG